MPNLDVEPTVGSLTIGVTALLAAATTVAIAAATGAVLVTRLSTLVAVGATATRLIVVRRDAVELRVVTHTATTTVAVDIEAMLTTVGEVAWVVRKADVERKPVTLCTTVPRPDTVPVDVTRRQDVRHTGVVLALMEVTVVVD